MSADDDDYLSDKFLAASSANSSTPRTYSQLRKEAQKRSLLKNEQNRAKSRRQLELESREAGLSKSLFERAKEEEDSGLSSGNKALSIMMKMGFKPGQSLGKTGDEEREGGPSVEEPSKPSSKAADAEPASKSNEGTPLEEEEISEKPKAHTKHKTEPLPLQEWAGRKGIGLGKRAASPSAAERVAKMAKMSEDANHRDFRERARDEYNNRRAEGRLGPAQLTCRTLDERMEKSFNVLWLNSSNHETFPPGLIDALAIHAGSTIVVESNSTDTIQSRLRKRMQAEALQPISNNVEDDAEPLSSKLDADLPSVIPPVDWFSNEFLEEAVQFLRLQAQDRLHLVLSYLRDKHAYCFWCGVEYETVEELRSQCPGSDEEDHD